MTVIVGKDFSEIGRITLDEGELRFSGNTAEMKALAEYYKGSMNWSNEELLEKLPATMNSRVWAKAA